ncbi:MAG: GNAT family N-acetyltransferase [Candidatus Obscuribacterales bacterium]|nr:GNAT family N-acetyltransferase [Candidatus Obscuribacterales bacterium]
MGEKISLTHSESLLHEERTSVTAWFQEVLRETHARVRDCVPGPAEYKDVALVVAAGTLAAGVACRALMLRGATVLEQRGLSAPIAASSRLEYSIVPLSRENLAGAIQTVNESFRHGWPYLRPGRDLRASLEATGCPRTVASGELNAKYWVAVDKQNRVLGTTGIYEMAEDAAEAGWVGWLGVGNAYRGHGVGRALINHTIEAARAEGKDFLRLYTSNHRAEVAAQSLYDSVGLKIYRTEPHFIPFSGLKIHYRELKLH